MEAENGDNDGIDVIKGGELSIVVNILHCGSMLALVHLPVEDKSPSLKAKAVILA